MGDLVTLAVAKAHLRITDDASNADLDVKIDQASDIIINYLKGRIIPVSSITSTGGVATVTTPTLHSLTTNDTVTVRGADQPEYNGVYVATVLTTTTFTYPISGTPVSPATGGVALKAVQGWTEATVPPRVQAAVLLVLTHLFWKRGDDPETDENLWNAVQRLLARDRDPALA